MVADVRFVLHQQHSHSQTNSFTLENMHIHGDYLLQEIEVEGSSIFVGIATFIAKILLFENSPHLRKPNWTSQYDCCNLEILPR